MSDTPISDSTAHNVAELGMLCRRLERELTASNAIIRQQQLLDEKNLGLQDRIERLEDARTVAAANSLANMISYENAITKIKRLEEAGDYCAELLDTIINNTAASERWCQAKEAKP